MAILLELANGKYAGRSRMLERGEPCRVGVKFGLELAVPDDPLLGAEHFVAIVTAKGVEVYALGGRKVVVVDGAGRGPLPDGRGSEGGGLRPEPGPRDGRPAAAKPTKPDSDSRAANGAALESGQGVAHFIAKPGEWLIAGESIFRVTDTDVQIGSVPETPIDQAAFLLRSVPDLFAIADVTGDRDWKARLESGMDPAQPVLEGFVERARAGAEPWLVHVTGNSGLTGYILRRAWGRGRIAFLRSKYSFESIRAFCRKKSGDRTARFHDPRWLRVALQALPANECNDWMGPIEEFHIESRLPSQMERWTIGANGAAVERIDLGLKREKMLPSSWEIEARFDSSRTLGEELASWASVTPERAERLIRRGVDSGLTNPGSLILYGLASLAFPGDGLDAALAKSADRARMVDLFVIAANRRREGMRVATA